MTGALQIVLSPGQLIELAQLVASAIGSSTSNQGLTLLQASARLAVSKATLQRMISDGRISASKIGRRTIIHTSEVDRILRSSIVREPTAACGIDEASKIALALLDRPRRRGGTR